MGATDGNNITLYSPLPPPEHRHENQDDGEYLQSADEHAETEMFNSVIPKLFYTH